MNWKLIGKERPPINQKLIVTVENVRMRHRYTRDATNKGMLNGAMDWDTFADAKPFDPFIEQVIAWDYYPQPLTAAEEVTA